MSEFAFSNRSAGEAVLDFVPGTSLAVAPLATSSEYSRTAGVAPETGDSTHRAVEAVLSAAERFNTGDRQSVDLHFTVGGTDLSVRVELRANQVQATFRSNSPELNSALIHEWQGSALVHEWQGSALVHEWQSVDGLGAGDRSLRFAPPIFTTNGATSDSSGLASFAGGDGSAHQRGAGARRGDEESEAFARGVRSANARVAGTAPASEIVPTVLRGTGLTTSPRLFTHA